MLVEFVLLKLLEVTKIQILKVIHNDYSTCRVGRTVVGSHKDTNFESNSQLEILIKETDRGCWESQRYKF